MKATFDNPDFPKGHEFEVRGLGVVENGKTFTVSEEMEERFLTETGQTLREALKGDEAWKLEGTAKVRDDKGGEE